MLNMLKRFLIKSFMPLILVASYIGFGIASPHFRTWSNLINILQQSSYLTLLALAQMMVLITRGFDLSVGTIIGLISVAASMTMLAVLKNDPNGLAWAILAAWAVGLAIGLVAGAVNGLVIAYLGLSPFMVTLGMMGVGLGFASTISGGFPIFDVPEAYVNLFSRAAPLGIPVAVVICLIILVLVHLVLTRTVFGRSLYLIGSSPRAAHVAGLPTKFRLAGAYVVCSLIVAVVALLLTARTGSGEPRLGISLMFESLMAAIIGGVALTGGEGHIGHCIIGGLFVTVLSNGMNLIRIDSNLQLMILGSVLIVTIVVDRFRLRIRS